MASVLPFYQMKYQYVSLQLMTLAAFMHRGLIVGAFRLTVGFFEKPAQRDPLRRLSAAEMV